MHSCYHTRRHIHIQSSAFKRRGAPWQLVTNKSMRSSHSHTTWWLSLLFALLSSTSSAPRSQLLPVLVSSHQLSFARARGRRITIRLQTRSSNEYPSFGSPRLISFTTTDTLFLTNKTVNYPHISKIDQIFAVPTKSQLRQLHWSHKRLLSNIEKENWYQCFFNYKFEKSKGIVSIYFCNHSKTKTASKHQLN